MPEGSSTVAKDGAQQPKQPLARVFQCRASATSTQRLSWVHGVVVYGALAGWRFNLGRRGLCHDERGHLGIMDLDRRGNGRRTGALRGACVRTPFHPTDQRLAAYGEHEWAAFWHVSKAGLRSVRTVYRVPPDIVVCNGKPCCRLTPGGRTTGPHPRFRKNAPQVRPISRGAETRRAGSKGSGRLMFQVSDRVSSRRENLLSERARS